MGAPTLCHPTQTSLSSLGSRLSPMIFSFGVIDKVSDHCGDLVLRISGQCLGVIGDEIFLNPHGAVHLNAEIVEPGLSALHKFFGIGHGGFCGSLRVKREIKSEKR